MILLNPKNHTRAYPDAISKEIMVKTIDFFERKGKRNLKADYRDRIWYDDFLEFQKDNQIFYNLLTPQAYGDGQTRWDTYRNCEFNEILGFYGLVYWYTWQVTILGLGPLWMSHNEAIKKRTAQLLKDGAIFGFGLSEREHGADIYTTDMTLSGDGQGGYKARGGKYYIGNGNKAAILSTFGRMAGTDNEYVFFAAQPGHEKFELVKNVVDSQMYVAEYALHDYPVGEADIIARGPHAWDSALNTVNVGKYNLGWASVGICTHALYESINHAANRRLYKMFVTDFPHVRQIFVDAYARLVAMKLFAQRASDYFRSANADDRRYLLYNPIVKMKVTVQGENIIDMLWNVIAAKGFENEMYFSSAASDIRGLPKLEGTAHVNMALIVKFMANYFFNPKAYPETPKRGDAACDSFLWDQGPTRGLGQIQFHDFRPVLAKWEHLPNVKIFSEQVKVLERFLSQATPSKDQARDTDFLLSLGEIFTLVPYGQLILEAAAHEGLEEALIDQIFDCFVRDFSKFAMELYQKPSSTDQQMDLCMKMIRRPNVDMARFGTIWAEHVYALEGLYEMND
ncbi:acyl-CoA dehydrogenase domain protein [Desulfarculus baarsii DSM 2075]|uniref:Acyl-CoA dehydrogenase domain protein n=1 Tax=Desulfarculus baarsii (strain ATCC 33931 / DSM 2075 / LMG 7858 / VKM B-1802 / 2st14) TaxID=644282 RepID=E1QH27_DESB2|nr:acyl-CoA dehydrogenase domain protein [Desulfarculus baarsii DSM 2075]